MMIKDLPRYECLREASREFPDLDPSATEAFLNLLRTGDEAFRIIEAHLGKYEITQGRFGVLMALWSHCHRSEVPCSLTPAELAERAGVTRATMTGLIDTLVRDGFVTRQPHAADRRMMCVCITEKGEKILHAILPQHFKQMAWLLEPLTEPERRTFVDLLKKIQLRAAERPVNGAQPLSSESTPVRQESSQ